MQLSEDKIKKTKKCKGVFIYAALNGTLIHLSPLCGLKQVRTQQSRSCVDQNNCSRTAWMRSRLAFKGTQLLWERDSSLKLQEVNETHCAFWEAQTEPKDRENKCSIRCTKYLKLIIYIIIFFMFRWSEWYLAHLWTVVYLFLSTYFCE